ncbi:hypothetical protein A0H81_00320 [Grifola frondosa]|uniref:Uncharacterized protein n=1 Tax=Grifola frondosa TaxID=5627 RepID=A0A1C7MR89_GRIFR|nr:hypothetical protein A0H81_00320 [Grifola frondosa]
MNAKSELAEVVGWGHDACYGHNLVTAAKRNLTTTVHWPASQPRPLTSKCQRAVLTDSCIYAHTLPGKALLKSGLAADLHLIGDYKPKVSTTTGLL